MVGSWCGWLVMVGGGFTIWGSCVSGRVVWWRVCWRWLIGFGMDVVVCFVCGRMLGCGVCLWRYSLGVPLRGGLLVRVHFVDVIADVESGCDLLVLLEACVFLRKSVFCCVSGDESPVASLSNVGSLGRLRFVLCVLCGWRFDCVVVRLICGRFSSCVVTEGEYLMTCCPRIARRGCDIARAWVLTAASFGSDNVAALSSGAFCLVAFGVFLFWGYPFFPCR